MYNICFVFILHTPTLRIYFYSNYQFFKPPITSCSRYFSTLWKVKVIYWYLTDNVKVKSHLSMTFTLIFQTKASHFQSIFRCFSIILNVKVVSQYLIYIFKVKYHLSTTSPRVTQESFILRAEGGFRINFIFKVVSIIFNTKDMKKESQSELPYIFISIANFKNIKTLNSQEQKMIETYFKY